MALHSDLPNSENQTASTSLLRTMRPKYTINGGNPAIQPAPSAQSALRYAMGSKITPVCGVADSNTIVAMDRPLNVILGHSVSTS